MKRLLQRLLKFTAYVAAAAVILLAVAVGLFRLLLPRLPEYQDEIKGWATAAIGMDVEFSGMNARWRLSGPELNFYNAELVLEGEAGGAFAAEEVSIGVDVMQLLLDRRLVVDRVVVRDSAIAVRKDELGRWRVQDIPVLELMERFARDSNQREITLIAEDFDVSYRHAPTDQLLRFAIGSLRMNRSPGTLGIDVIIELPATLGNRLSASISSRRQDAQSVPTWQYTIDTRNLNLAGWSGLQPEGLPPLEAGTADLSASLQQSANQVRNALIDFDVSGMQAAGGEAFGAEGRLEFQHDLAGWLLVADDLRLRTARGIWPQSSVSVQAGTADDGTISTVAAAASYLDLDDLALLLPWWPAGLAETWRSYAPSGQLANLVANAAELGTDRPRYDLALELSEAGVRATERFPGVRGFSGSVRANRLGGRVEIDAANLQVDLSRWLSAPVDVTSAQGTVIWRRNAEGTIVLSDSVRLQNDDLTSRTSVQLSLPADGSSPVLDLESRWSIFDLSAARRYLPGGLMGEGLHRWLSGALVAGRVPVGTTRVSGALDRFPFDDGDGIFRVEARLEEAILRYSDQWPDVENLDLDLVIDGTRLYSERNTASNAGNSVADARIEIADLRNPVLTIDAFATGTLETIRRFARQSPIERLFGGHLDRVGVAGDASFTLALEYPILRRQDFAFTTRIQASNGTLRIDGLRPPVTELNGIVEITRESIASEALFGRFLGEPVDIDLRNADASQPGYSVVAEVDGRFTVDGLVTAFGLPEQAMLQGGSAYTGRVLFPRGGSDAPAPLNITINSDLDGLTIDLPTPLAKARNTTRNLDAMIEFPEAGRVETMGSLGDALRWTLGFLRSERGWDFDRGVLAAGGAYPGDAGTRGLHIAGNVAELHLNEWLAVARGDGTRRAGGIAERIRAIDLAIADLYVLGQHFDAHRVVVDRSGADWIVQVSGEQAEGTVTIPYNFASGRVLALDMQRLVLPGSDDNGGTAGISTDPRTVPPISVRIRDFALGSRRLGDVQADFERTPDGLVAQQIRSERRSFTLDGSAGWVVDTREPSGQRTWVTAVLKSNDVAATLQSLQSNAGIVGEDMEIRFDVHWSGGPREDFAESLSGDVTVRLGTGQLDEVEPGAGRMFGLMSVVALPRRLALDFRDVLDRGFLFDEITGTFRLDRGDAYTCDLSLKGPAADIGIVGRTGLVEKDYTQTAIVSANVGNTLPVVGAVVAGPQVAAALLIFSQIFKKPLQEMGQVYYGIDGSWEQPQVDSANAARFADNSRLAGCLASGG